MVSSMEMGQIFAEITDLLRCGETLAARQQLDAVRENVPADEMWRWHELYGAVFHDLADAEGAAAAYSNAAKCDKYLRSQRQHFSNYLFALHYLPGLGAADFAQQHKIYGSLYRDEEVLPPRQGIMHSRLRIGFMAEDFCDSAAARFYEALVTGFDVRYAEVYLYALSQDEDAFTHRLQAWGLTYRCLAEQSLADMAAAIRWDEIDVLIDLTGHTAGGLTLMVLARKPAPVQLSAIGYFDTTGLTAVDGLLTDKQLNPTAAEQAFFSEELIYLPQALCFTPAPAMQQLKRQPRRAGAVTFGCFQNYMKLNREVLAAWRQIMAACPGARLIVQDTTRLPGRRQMVERRLENAGLPMERVEVRLGTDNYLADYQEIDIMLDTFPYNGGAMTATALYMGVPVVTLRGAYHSARFGASLLTAAGHSEWIADDVAGYIKNALQLASNPEFLADTQLYLREDISQAPLLDSQSYGEAVWQAIVALWGRKGDFAL